MSGYNLNESEGESHSVSPSSSPSSRLGYLLEDRRINSDVGYFPSVICDMKDVTKANAFDQLTLAIRSIAIFFKGKRTFKEITELIGDFLQELLDSVPEAYYPPKAKWRNVILQSYPE